MYSLKDIPHKNIISDKPYKISSIYPSGTSGIIKIDDYDTIESYAFAIFDDFITKDEYLFQSRKSKINKIKNR